MQTHSRRNQFQHLMHDGLFFVRPLFHMQEGDSRTVFLSERKGISGLPFDSWSEIGRKQDVLKFNAVVRLTQHIRSDGQHGNASLAEDLFCAGTDQEFLHVAFSVCSHNNKIDPIFSDQSFDAWPERSFLDDFFVGNSDKTAWN